MKYRNIIEKNLNLIIYKMSNIFLNLSLENTTDDIIQAKVGPITRLENIFNNEQNTKNFNLSVNRFALPSGLIELLFIDDEYFIETKIKNTLCFNTDLSNENVFDLTGRTYLDKTQKIYSYEQFIEIFNRTLFENYYKLSKELLRNCFTTNTIFNSKTKINGQGGLSSQSPLLVTDTSFHKIEQYTHTFPESGVSNLIGIEFKITEINLPVYTNNIKCVLISPNNQEFCIFNNRINNTMITKNITFNEYSQNDLQGEIINETDLEKARFRESSLDVLNDNPTGNWTVRFEYLRIANGSETDGDTHFEYEIEYIYPTKPNVKRDGNYTTNTQLETPNTPMYVSFDDNTNMDYFQLNYHQNFNRLGIDLGLSPKLNFIIEFDNKKDNDVHFISFPKTLYNENATDNPILKYKQEFNSVFKICHACLIEFRTSQIPIQKELQTKSGVSSSILTDFEIPVSSMNQNGMFYFNSVQKRLYPITSEYFKSYDLSIFIKYINIDGNKEYVPLNIKPHERVNVKLEIEPKL